MAAGRLVRSVPWLRRQYYFVHHHKILSEVEAKAFKGRGWFAPLTALRQQRAYDRLLRDLQLGNARRDFLVAAEAIDALGKSRITILEIGCGSGYYSEVLAKLSKTEIGYTGLDNAPPMITRARRRYPRESFEVGSATKLPFSDGSFDIAFNGVSLMHILDYRQAISEAKRVSRLGCIFHAVPLF